MRSVSILVFVTLLPLSVCGCRKSSEPRKDTPTPAVKPADPTTAPFVAGKRNKVFHKRDCPYAANLDSPVGYASLQDAESSGHIPCVFCSPRASEGPEKTP